jgi:hypothetical protein
MKQHDNSEYIIGKCSEAQILMNGQTLLNFLSRKNKKYRLIIWKMFVTIQDSITFLYHLLPKNINISVYHCMGITLFLALE